MRAKPEGKKLNKVKKINEDTIAVTEKNRPLKISI